MQLHFESFGSGPPLIILHGLFGSLENWRSTTRRLAESFTVFAVDQRNHGRSPHVPEMTYPLMAEDLREFLDQRGLQTAHILGHSMGGKTAMQFALNHPERVNRLVIADIAPQVYPPHHREIIDALLSLDLSKHQTRAEIQSDPAIANVDPAVRQFLMKDLKKGSDGAFQWQMNLQGISKCYSALIEGVASERPYEKPALFLRGEKSRFIKPEDEAVIRKFFPQATIQTLEGAGHWLHVEAPEAFVRNVRDFLFAGKTSG